MSMKTLKQLLIAAGFTLLATLNAVAGEIKVVANLSVKSDVISAVELRRVFLEERSSLADGTHVEPVLQKRGAPHAAFLTGVLGRNDDDLQTFYRALVFTGRGSMPKILASDAEVVAYVARTKGAIGYVSPAASANGVKVLTIVSEGSDAERMLLARVEPEYPDTLRRLKIGGTVRLAVTVSARGKVEDVQVLGGNPILGEAAASAVQKWVYSPGRSRTVVQVSVPFDPPR